MGRNTRRLKAILDGKMGRARKNLDSDLRDLEHKIRSAREALANGDHMDECMITNSNGITARIAEWNLIRDSLPYLDEEEQG